MEIFLVFSGVTVHTQLRNINSNIQSYGSESTIICVASIHPFLFCHIQHFCKIHLPSLDNQELCINWIAKKYILVKGPPNNVCFSVYRPKCTKMNVQYVLKWIHCETFQTQDVLGLSSEQPIGVTVYTGGKRNNYSLSMWTTRSI